MLKKELDFIPQGGTAVGSGINAPKNFDKSFCKFLNKMTINKYICKKFTITDSKQIKK